MPFKRSGVQVFRGFLLGKCQLGCALREFVVLQLALFGLSACISTMDCDSVVVGLRFRKVIENGLQHAQLGFQFLNGTRRRIPGSRRKLSRLDSFDEQCLQRDGMVLSEIEVSLLVIQKSRILWTGVP